MKRSVLVTTLAAAVALAPLVIWTKDILCLSLAALIPFYVDLKNEHLN